MPERRLSLVRHGRSAYVHPGGWVTRAGMDAWRRGYDEAGILDHDAPPPTVARLGESADLVVASDFPRAIVTAERLAPERQILVSPLLREAPVPWPSWNSARLPVPVWQWAVTLGWGWRIIRGTDIPPRDLERGTRAAMWLDDLAREHEHVVVVTHGVFRRILARQLERIGWSPDGTRRSYDHWSVWSLSSDSRPR